jgi:hypothetical protein
MSYESGSEDTQNFQEKTRFHEEIMSREAFPQVLSMMITTLTLGRAKKRRRNQRNTEDAFLFLSRASQRAATTRDQ